MRWGMFVMSNFACNVAGERDGSDAGHLCRHAAVAPAGPPPFRQFYSISSVISVSSERNLIIVSSERLIN